MISRLALVVGSSLPGPAGPPQAKGHHDGMKAAERDFDKKQFYESREEKKKIVAKTDAEARYLVAFDRGYNEVAKKREKETK